MARGTVNKVILIGRLGTEPEMRYSPNGTAIVRLSVATNERVPAGEGNWEDRTEWHRIVAFGKTAEFCGNYLGKGKQVYIEGRIQTRQWEDAQGQKRYTTEIVARDIQMLGSVGDQPQVQSDQYGMNAGSSGSGSGNRSGADELPPHSGGAPEEDIPF